MEDGSIESSSSNINTVSECRGRRSIKSKSRGPKNNLEFLSCMVVRYAT